MMRSRDNTNNQISIQFNCTQYIMASRERMPYIPTIRIIKMIFM